METVYNCCIVAGITIPVFSLFSGIFGDIGDIDMHLDSNATFAIPIPLSPINIAIFLVCFGGAGKISLLLWSAVGGIITQTILNVGSAIIGLVIGVEGVMCIDKYIITPLKKNDSTATKFEDLVGERGELILAILDQDEGTISVKRGSGGKITYIAKSFDNKDIPMGTMVEIIGIELEQKTCIVRPLEKYESA